VEIIAWAEQRAVAWTNIASVVARDDIRLELGPQADVTGTIRDEAGKPQAKATVQVWGITSERRQLSDFFDGEKELNLGRSEFSLAADTDAEGRFQISHLPVEQRVILAVVSPTLVRQTLLIDTAAKPAATKIRFRNGGQELKPVSKLPLEVSVKRQRALVVKVTDHAGQAVVDGTVQGMGGTPQRFAMGEPVND
jgi:hypothetical protein